MKIPCKVVKIDLFTSKKGNKCAFVWVAVNGLGIPCRILCYKDIDKLPSVGSDAYLTITANSDLFGTLELIY